VHLKIKGAASVYWPHFILPGLGPQR